MRNLDYITPFPTFISLLSYLYLKWFNGSGAIFRSETLHCRSLWMTNIWASMCCLRKLLVSRIRPHHTIPPLPCKMYSLSHMS